MKSDGPEIQWPGKGGGDSHDGERKSAPRSGWLGGIPKSRTTAILLLAGYVVLIFVMSSRPRPRSPFDLQHADKLVHAVEYGILGWLLARAVGARGNLSAGRVAFTCILGAVLVGAADELNQARVPGRDSSVWDLVADASGAAAAVLLWLKVRRMAVEGE